jgi:hypothetical protein
VREDSDVSCPLKLIVPIPVAVRSKAYVCSVAGFAGSNPTEVVDIRLLCLLYELTAYAISWSIVQRSPTVCVSNCV